MNHIYDDEICPGREETIHRYLDGELRLAEREVFVAHLQRCSTCRVQLAELQTLFAELAALEETSPPETLVSQVISRLPAASPAPPAGRVSHLALMAQIMSGLVLMAVARPLIEATLESWPIWQPGPVVVEMGLSLASWLIELRFTISQGLDMMWLPVFAPFNISATLALTLTAGLMLAWLAGNTLLLQRDPGSLKNGGPR